MGGRRASSCGRQGRVGERELQGLELDREDDASSKATGGLGPYGLHRRTMSGIASTSIWRVRTRFSRATLVSRRVSPTGAPPRSRVCPANRGIMVSTSEEIWASAISRRMAGGMVRSGVPDRSARKRQPAPVSAKGRLPLKAGEAIRTPDIHVGNVLVSGRTRSPRVSSEVHSLRVSPLLRVNASSFIRSKSPNCQGRGERGVLRTYP